MQPSPAERLTYIYNAFGELVWQQDARGVVTVMHYDDWGNMTRREVDYYGVLLDGDDTSSEAPEVSTWSYCYSAGYNPSTGAYRFGQLLSETGPYGYETVLDYDKLGRLMIEWKQIDQQWFFTDYQYDGYGRLETRNYNWKPAGEFDDYSQGSPWNSYLVTRHYSPLGFLTAVEGSDDSTRTWFEIKDTNLSHYDHLDRARESTIGGLIDQTLSYDPETEALTGIKSESSGAGEGSVYQDHTYQYNEIGSLRYREEREDFADESARQRQEWLFYDNLNRYTHSYQTGSDLAQTGFTAQTSYDDFGNITYRDGKSYNYNSQRKTQLQWWGGDYLQYDANGNLSGHYQAGSGEWQTYAWKGFNKPEVIWNFEGLDSGAHFWYDNRHRRIVQVTTLNGQKDRKTLYAGGLEQEYRYDESYDVTGSAHDDWRPLYTRIHIAGPNGTVGCYTQKSAHSDDTGAETGRSLYLNDYPGNLNVVVKQPGGEVAAQLSFDAWGNRRDPLTWARYGDPAAHTPEDANGHRLSRGYTGHEMLDELGLVHMNGRLYDPLLGRMLSADPVVQTPENLQNYNRYSYVLNNPVSYTDPSGYVPVFSLFAMAFVVSEGMHIVTVATIMFVAGFADALLMGANPRQAFKSGLIAAAATVITYHVGNHFNKMYGSEYASNGRISNTLDTAIEQGNVDINWNIEVARHLTHGAAQGGLAESTGGDFGASFLATFASSLVGSAMMMPEVAGSQFFGSFEGQLVAMTIVGGTVSEIGGGKFANGAYSAALVKVLNLAKKRMAQEGEKEIVAQKTYTYEVDSTYSVPVGNDRSMEMLTTLEVDVQVTVYKDESYSVTITDVRLGEGWRDDHNFLPIPTPRGIAPVELGISHWLKTWNSSVVSKEGVPNRIIINYRVWTKSTTKLHLDISSAPVQYSYKWGPVYGSPNRAEISIP